MADKGFGVKEINLIGASGTPTIESPNNINLNAVNVAISTNVSIGGTLSVTGNISIGGTLTYEDVTNIDSVGIITARSGIDCNGTLEVSSTANFDDTVKIADKIEHLGDSNTNIRFPEADNFTVECAGAERFRVKPTNDVAIFTGSNSATLTIRNDTSNEMQIHSGSSDALILGSGGENERLRIDSSGHIHTGYATNVTGADHVNILASDGGGVSVAQNNAGNATSGTTIGSYSFQGYHQGGATFASAEARISAIAAANHTGSSAATDLAFYTKPAATGPGSSPTERLRIDSSGNASIGGITAAPTSTVYNSGTLHLHQATGGASGGSQLKMTTSQSGSAAGDGAYIAYYGNNEWYFYNRENAAISFGTNSAERLRITSTGALEGQTAYASVGINTFAKFTRTGGGGPHLEIGYNAVTSDYGYFGTGSAHDLGLRTNDVTRLRIGSDGKFYYGTTSQGPAGGYFNINASSSSANGLNVQGTTANYVIISSAGGSTGDHIYFANWSNSNTNTGRIKDNQSNVTYHTSSDYRLKDNVVSISDGITRVKQLNPVRHTWKTNPAIGTVDGWIAHEVDAICPDAVDGVKDAVNDDGSIYPQAVDYGRITPLLTAALKEAIAKIETLETEVAALKSS